MDTAFITGANKSIGFATARELLRRDYRVFLGSRDLDAGRQAVAQLASEGLTSAEAVRIDVTDTGSVRAARDHVAERTDILDVLVNNAGMSGGRPQDAPGFVATDFNQHRGTGSVDEAGRRVAELATIGPDGPTGTFVSREYNPDTGAIPW